MQQVAVIVLHYGDPETTYDCLKSLSKIANAKVFVVDNGSINLKRNEVERLSKDFNLIQVKNNLGFSGGNNVGIKKALGLGFEYILILNNDTTVNPKLIQELIKPFRNNDIGITCPVITYYDNPEKIWFAGGYFNNFFCYTRHIYMNQSLDKTPKEVYVDFATGAAMMIRKDVFNRVGLFSEDYFLYWEDADLCFRAQQAGFKCFLVNKPLVKHKISSSTGIKGSNALSPTRAYYYARNPFVFIRNNKLNLIPSVLGQLTIRFPYYILHVKNFAAFKAYGRGLVDGFKTLFKPVG